VTFFLESPSQLSEYRMHALQARRTALSASNAALEAENFQLKKLLKEAPRTWDTTVIEITVWTNRSSPVTAFEFYLVGVHCDVDTCRLSLMLTNSGIGKGCSPARS
jgi:hypothetical protein